MSDAERNQDDAGQQAAGSDTSAPGSAQGQADGSPPAGDNSTSGGEGDPVKELRRELTRKGEELAAARKAGEILERAMDTPEWQAVHARLTGQPVETEDDPLLLEVYGKDGLPIGKKYEERLLAKAEQRLLSRLGPVVREVGVTKEERSLARAIRSEGVTKDDAFDDFREDFEAENPSYRKLKSVDPDAAAKWLVSSYAIQGKRNGRPPVGDRADASLERGGSVPSRVGAASSQAKIDRSNPNWIHQLHEAITKGETPVDATTGRPIKVKGAR